MGQRIKLPEPVADIYWAVVRLEVLYPGRKFTPDGHLVGSIGEVIAAESLAYFHLHNLPPTGVMSRYPKLVRASLKNGDTRVPSSVVRSLLDLGAGYQS